MTKEELEQRYEDQLAGKARRSYSEGRLSADDDGDLAAAIFVHDKANDIRGME